MSLLQKEREIIVGNEFVSGFDFAEEQKVVFIDQHKETGRETVRYGRRCDDSFHDIEDAFCHG